MYITHYISVICSQQMPNFSARMHQIQFRLRPDPASGGYSAPASHVTGGEGAGCPLSKNPATPHSALRASVFSPSGLDPGCAVLKISF